VIPFRSQPPQPRLREGYQLLQQPTWDADELDQLLLQCGDSPRGGDRWALVLERSSWHLSIRNDRNRLVGFIRATSDQALNANLWDLLADPGDDCRDEVIQALVQAALSRLRREMGGCSVSLAAPPEALRAVTKAGFVVDPGGIRAMGLNLKEP
jgi:hypothetical protein